MPVRLPDVVKRVLSIGHRSSMPDSEPGEDPAQKMREHFAVADGTASFGDFGAVAGGSCFEQGAAVAPLVAREKERKSMTAQAVMRQLANSSGGGSCGGSSFGGSDAGSTRSGAASLSSLSVGSSRGSGCSRARASSAEGGDGDDTANLDVLEDLTADEICSRLKDMSLVSARSLCKGFMKEFLKHIDGSKTTFPDGE